MPCVWTLPRTHSSLRVGHYLVLPAVLALAPLAPCSSVITSASSATLSRITPVHDLGYFALDRERLHLGVSRLRSRAADASNGLLVVGGTLAALIVAATDGSGIDFDRAAEQPFFALASLHGCDGSGAKPCGSSRPDRAASAFAEMPFLAFAMRAMALNHVDSGKWVSVNIVPVVAVN